MPSELDKLVSAPLVIDWRLKSHMLCTWEVDMPALEAAIPGDLEPIEVRSDVGLVSLTCMRYRTDHFYPGSPEFSEIMLFAPVQGDLSVRMPEARFNAYTMSVYSDSPDFVAQEGRTLYTPTVHVPSLRVDFDVDKLTASAADERGPIVSFRNTGGAPKWSYEVLWGQHYNDTQGRLVQGIWNWDGTMFEHMQRGDYGRMHQHPFFGKLDVSRVRSCYRQMFMQPETEAHERFYEVTMI